MACLRVSTFLLVSYFPFANEWRRVRGTSLTFFLLVKYSSPPTNLCILRVARGPATSDKHNLSSARSVGQSRPGSGQRRRSQGRPPCDPRLRYAAFCLIPSSG